ncbi:MAG TPA: endonuclease V [Thermoplasmata archaeon]|nr:endonuclease V [Thermoplasmata archaeon]
MRIPNIDLHAKVDDLVAQVPEGMVTTYGEVAKALGDIVASRFVGKVMSENDDVVRVPCRRVVQSDGTIGGFTGEGGPQGKKKLLRAEGIDFEGDRIVDFEKRLFADFKTDHPLKKFKDIQKRDLKKLVLRDDPIDDLTVAGSDIAYIDDNAFGSMVIFDLETRKPKEVINARAKASFPYIPTYLTFREAPIVEQLVRKAGCRPLLVHDGNGIIHPLGFGVASHIGVMLDLPTIGVAKKLLCGSVSGSGKFKQVKLRGRMLGYAVTGKGWSSPVYVSPGHRTSVKSSIGLLKPYWQHRLPDPVRIAHIEAERSRRAVE